MVCHEQYYLKNTHTRCKQNASHLNSFFEGKHWNLHVERTGMNTEYFKNFLKTEKPPGIKSYPALASHIYNSDSPRTNCWNWEDSMMYRCLILSFLKRLEYSISFLRCRLQEVPSVSVELKDELLVTRLRTNCQLRRIQSGLDETKEHSTPNWRIFYILSDGM